MGKLRDTLNNASKMVLGVQTAAEKSTKQMAAIRTDVLDWRDNGFTGIDEFCLYMLEKLKKDKIDVKSLGDTPLKDHLDKNVAQYLKGLEFMIKQASDASVEFSKAVADKDLDDDIAALEKVLADATAQITKKKKKLLQSKKFKTKIAGYATTLDDLKTRVSKMKDSLKELRKNPPPSPKKVRDILGFTAESKVKDLLANLSGKKKELHEDYNSLVLKLNQTENQIRKEAEFAGNMKVLKDMLTDAEEMDKETVGV